MIGFIQTVFVFIAALLLGDTWAHTCGIFLMGWALMPLIHVRG